MHEFAELHFLGTALLKKFSPNELVMPRLLPFAFMLVAVPSLLDINWR